MRHPRKTLLLFLLSISSCLLLISCAPKQPEPIYITEYVYFIPEKVTIPDKPAFKKLDPAQPIGSEYNLRRLQQNTVLWKNYSNALRKSLLHYEDLIDQMQEQKDLQETKALVKLAEDQKK